MNKNYSAKTHALSGFSFHRKLAHQEQAAKKYKSIICLLTATVAVFFLSYNSSLAGAEIVVNCQGSGEPLYLIGGGPASLTVANDLLPLGYSCTIFEAQHVAGGLMRYNIPAFRLPSEVLDEEILPKQLLVSNHRDYHIVDVHARFMMSRVVKESGSEDEARRLMKERRRMGHRASEVVARASPHQHGSSSSQVPIGRSTRARRSPIPT